jgi:hypothetical protein
MIIAPILRIRHAIKLKNMMNTNQQTSAQLFKAYFELSSTIFASTSPQEISAIKNRLWEIRKEMKNSDIQIKK